MRQLGLREAKSSLSAIVDAAEKGEATTITRRGRPAAVLVPIRDAERLYPIRRQSFAALLMAIPEAIETDRDASPLRPAEL